jgi:hypothetical protein
LFQNQNIAAPALRISLDPVAEVRRADELDNAFFAIASAHPDALAVLADRFLLANRKRIVEYPKRGLTADLSLPVFPCRLNRSTQHRR